MTYCLRYLIWSDFWKERVGGGEESKNIQLFSRVLLPFFRSRTKYLRCSQGQERSASGPRLASDSSVSTRQPYESQWLITKAAAPTPTVTRNDVPWFHFCCWEKRPEKEQLSGGQSHFSSQPLVTAHRRKATAAKVWRNWSWPQQGVQRERETCGQCSAHFLDS